jgi:hypothetical protein
VAHAAGLLSELLSLAPAGGTPLAVSGSTRQGSLKGRGAEVQAGRDAWLWGHADLAEGTAASAPNPAPPGMMHGGAPNTVAGLNDFACQPAARLAKIVRTRESLCERGVECSANEPCAMRCWHQLPIWVALTLQTIPRTSGPCACSVWSGPGRGGGSAGPTAQGQEGGWSQGLQRCADHVGVLRAMWGLSRSICSARFSRLTMGAVCV